MNKWKILIIVCVSVCLALLIYPIIKHIGYIATNIQLYQSYYDTRYMSYLIFRNTFIAVSLFIVFALLVVGLIAFLKLDLTVYGEQYKQSHAEKKLRKAEAQDERRKARTAKRKARLLAELDDLNKGEDSGNADNNE